MFPFKIFTNDDDTLERKWIKDADHAFRNNLHDHSSAEPARCAELDGERARVDTVAAT